jgi:ABC-type multidrug transport system fused ATPase/permease subunit
MKIPLRQYWALLVDYLRPQWPQVALLTVLLLGSIGLQLANPQIMRTFIDAATAAGADAGSSAATAAGADAGSSAATAAGAAAGESVRLRNMALLFIGVALAQQAASIAATYLSTSVGWWATNELRADLVEHCIDLDMSFHNAHTPGEMIERLDGDVTALTNFFSQFTIQVFGSTLLMLGVLVLMYREDWRAGAAFTATAALALTILGGLRNIAVPHWEAERQASAEMFGFLEERLAGTEDIRACGARPYVMLRFYQLMRALYRRELKAGLMVNIMVNSTSLSFALGNAMGLAMGATLYRRGVFTLGTAYIVSYYSGMLIVPIMRMTHQLQDLQRAGAGIARIRELQAVRTKIAAPPATAPSTPAPRLPAGRALQVEFEGVSFGYDDALPGGAPGGQPPAGKQTVLHELSFTLRPGTVLGLLGRTGSGKTTLTRLLFRLYDADQGQIWLDASGRPDTPSLPGAIEIRQVPLLDLRHRIGMVTQNIQLFQATVRDNLTFFDADVPDAEIMAVIEALGLGEWYRALPQGLDTELQSGGSGLSAGEAQLLAFTRIFLQDPGLVVLDEASSRLDPATERLIERAVDRLVRGRTAIVIAHRLGTVQRADEIMILDEGRIQEHGPREALARDPGSRFARLLQTGLEEVLV